MNILTDLLAILSILSGIIVITAKNPIISVIFLVVVFLNVAGYLILLGIAYLGLVYLIVYIGAIAILFLFVIMMLNLRLVELVETGQNYTKNLPIGTLLGSLFLFELFSVIYQTDGQNLGGVQQGDGKIADIFMAGPILNLKYFTGSNSNFDISVNNIFNNNSVILEETIIYSSQIESIGQSLYTYASLWLIISSLIFLLAMVGPIVLCMNSSSSSA